MRTGRAGLVCGMALIALGVVAVAEGVRVQDDWPGAKLMPIVIGAALVVLGAAHLVTPLGEPPVAPDEAARRRVALVLGSLTLYVAAVPYAGFLPATALLLLVLVRALGGYGWPRVAVTTIATAVACEVVFRRWLGMSLP